MRRAKAARTDKFMSLGEEEVEGFWCQKVWALRFLEGILSPLPLEKTLCLFDSSFDPTRMKEPATLPQMWTSVGDLLKRSTLATGRRRRRRSKAGTPRTCPADCPAAVAGGDYGVRYLLKDPLKAHFSQQSGHVYMRNDDSSSRS